MSLDASIKNDLSHIYRVPREIVWHIFGFLSKEDLGRASQVCRIWNEWVSNHFLCYNSDLKTQFPSVKIIDKNDWKAFLDLDIQDEQPLDRHADIPVLQNLISSLKGRIEEDAGLTLITIPKNVDLNELLKIASNPKRGNAAHCRFVWENIIKEFGNKSVSKTVRVVITNNILKGSRKQSAEQQKKLVENLGLEMPELLPIIALIFMTHISSRTKPPTRLYKDNPYTYSRLKEKIYSWNLVIGGFALVGLELRRSVIENKGNGVGGLWKFSGQRHSANV